MIISQLVTKIRSRKLTLQSSAQSGFTLIELLIVIALIAILSTIIIITLNPAEILAKGRDSQRFSDMATLNTAMSLYIADKGSGSLGTSTIIYNTKCAASSAPYNDVKCEAGGNIGDFRKVDATGWVGTVNFATVNGGSPISVLPVDPKNDACTVGYTTQTFQGCFYLFKTDGTSKWEFAATGIESKYYTTAGVNNYAGSDGGGTSGDCDQWYEVGTDLTLISGTAGTTNCTVGP